MQIIGLLDVFTPSGNLTEFSDVYLVTHLMGADLNNIVKTQKLSDDHVQFLVYQILRGMKYVHSAGIIHRVSSERQSNERKLNLILNRGSDFHCFSPRFRVDSPAYRRKLYSSLRNVNDLSRKILLISEG